MAAYQADHIKIAPSILAADFTHLAEEVGQVISGGADLMTIHIESDNAVEIDRAVTEVRRLNRKIGLSVKPKTPVEAIRPWLKRLDLARVSRWSRASAVSALCRISSRRYDGCGS